MPSELTDLESKVLALSQAALPPAQIGERLDISEAEVKAELEALLSNRHPGITAEHALELERMDTLIRAVWVKAVAGEASAISSVTSLMSRRKKLLQIAELGDSAKAPSAQLTGLMRTLVDKTLARCNNIDAEDDIGVEEPDTNKE